MADNVLGAISTEEVEASDVKKVEAVMEFMKTADMTRGELQLLVNCVDLSEEVISYRSVKDVYKDDAEVSRKFEAAEKAKEDAARRVMGLPERSYEE